jgi:hypothetical protein
MWLLVGGDSEIGAATYKMFKAQGLAAAATRGPAAARILPARNVAPALRVVVL